MANISQFNSQEVRSQTSVLKDIFDWYVENTITNEQIQRVLEPVLRMICEGRFDRSRPSRFAWLFKPTISTIAVMTLIYIVWVAG